MFDLHQMDNIEREFGFSYPLSFVRFIGELVAISRTPAFLQLMPQARFLSLTSDVRLAYENGLPAEFIPFMAEEQPANIDYYVFDTTTGAPEFKVSVFAKHALVMNWDNFESFLAWVRQR